MIPDTDIGAISCSHSNHSDRKSTADIVIILTLPISHSSPWPRTCRANLARRRSSNGLRASGSGASPSIIGLTSRPSSAIFCPNCL